MRTAFRALLILSVALILTMSPACKKWEGRYTVSGASGSTIYYQGTNESIFAVAIQVTNAETVGVGAVIVDWVFEVYEDDFPVLKINRSNYDRLDFLVTVVANTPVPDSSSTFPGYGYLNVVTGREVDQWRVPGDIFDGRTPNRIKFNIVLLDDNQYTNSISGEIHINHAVLD